MRTAREREPPLIRPGSELREAWKAELFAQDHNYSGFSGPKSDHDRLVMMERASAYVQAIIDNALSDLGGSFDAPELRGQQPVLARLVAFNPLSWDRDDVVEVELPLDAGTTGAVVVDGQGHAQEVQVEGRVLTFPARGIPALGCRAYDLVPPGSEKHPPLPDAVPGSRASWLEELAGDDRVTIETPWFRAALSRGRGCIESLVCKTLKRELVRPAGPRVFGELVSYEDTGPDVRYRFTGAVGRDSAVPYGLRRVRSGPLSATWAFEGCFNNARVEKLVTLHRDLPHIDLEIVVYWWGQRNTQVRLCLPFAAEDFSQTWYGVPFHAVRWPTMMDGIEDSVILGMESNPDELAAEDRRHFREAVAWVDVGYRAYGVTVAVMQPGLWIDGALLEIPLVRSNRSCGDPTVWPDNSGRRSWSFRLLPHTGDWRSARGWRTGWELNSPVVVRALAAADRSEAKAGSSAGPVMPSSFFRVGQDNVVITAVKAADDGTTDVILRYYEAEGTAGTVSIECCRPVVEAAETDLLEQPVARLETRGCRVFAPTRPHQIKTVRLTLA